MAAPYLSIVTGKPGATEVILINGEPSTTGYIVARSGGVDLGGTAYDKVYSGPRGTQGAMLVGATAQNRLSTWTLQVIGTSEDDLQAKLSRLWQLDEDLRRYGGIAYWQNWNSSFRMQLQVLDSGIRMVGGIDPDLQVLNHRANVELGLATPPYMNGPPMDLVDDFSSDTETNYTFDTGSPSDLAVSGGSVTVVANPTVEKRLIHTAVGYQFSDVQATLKATPGSTITSFLAGVILNRIDASNYLRVYVDDNGTNSRLRIDKVVAGVTTNLATTNLGARVANGVPFWIRGRVEGVNVFAEHFASADFVASSKTSGYSEPSPMQTPTTSTSYTLSTGEQATFGETTVGRVGIVWIPQQSAALLDDFLIQPYVYRAATLPDNFIMRGPIPGDAQALLEAVITPSGGSAPIWASLGWWPQVGIWNRCFNGDFEVTKNGWDTAAVTNINGAATSITRIGTASKFGGASGQIVCPATADTGASFRIFRRFRKGVTYTAEAWIHAASAVTNTYIRLGNGAANDKATSGNTALSTTWQRITITWTPTADRDDAHVAINIAAATATTFEIDGVMVYEGTTAPTTPNQSEGRGGFPPLGVVEAENFNGPAGNITSSANFRSGFAITAGTSPNLIVDPSLLTPEDYGTSIAIEVWARLELVQGSTTATCILQANPLTLAAGGATIYSEEYGSAGKTVALPGIGTVRRFDRLGTLRLPTDAGRYTIQVGSTNASLDYFLFLPAADRALSPNGRVNDSTFPSFVTTNNETIRRILSDLSGRMKEPSTGQQESQAPGLGGALLEIPNGITELIVKLSSLVPDDPSINSTTEALAQTATVRLKVTPRWRLGRSS